MKQHTLSSSFQVEGKGLHTGVYTHALFLPSDEHTGIRIRRTDLTRQPIYHAVADFVSATERSTVLEHGSWRVSTVEHALSALYALGIDNCLIEVDGPEIPILDGSALPFVKAIREVGITEQQAEAEVYRVTEPIEYLSEHGNKLLLLPAEKYEVEVQVSYPSQILRYQQAELRDLNDYQHEIAAARTFCFVREIEPLLRMGLIKGGDLKNALVIYETPMSQEGLDYLTDKLGQPHLDATKLGYLSPIHYHNEPARHKLLDIIGDLALVGCRLQARIIAVKPGHTFNTSCAKQLRNKIFQ